MGKTPAPNKENRTRDGIGWTILPAAGREGAAPPLSLRNVVLALDPSTDTKYKARARELWRKWWSSPMALMWAVDDSHVLQRLLVLTARSWGGGSSSEMSEIRQLEDRFGLNPKARRSLYWRIEGVDTPSVEAGDLSGGAVTAAPVAGGSEDPRLRIVKGGKAS